MTCDPGFETVRELFDGFFAGGREIGAGLSIWHDGREIVSLDEPLAKSWPAYGAHGKESTTLRQLLCHTAGQPSFPAIGLHASASGLAKFYWDLTRPDGPVALAIGADLLHEYTTTQSSGFDHYLERDTVRTLGFQLDEGDIAMGGLGGSSAWYDPARDYAMAYVTHGLGEHDRADELWHATVDCLS